MYNLITVIPDTNCMIPMEKQDGIDDNANLSLRCKSKDLLSEWKDIQNPINWAWKNPGAEHYISIILINYTMTSFYRCLGFNSTLLSLFAFIRSLLGIGIPSFSYSFTRFPSGDVTKYSKLMAFLCMEKR